MGTQAKIRLLLVDDQLVVRRGLRMWLGLEPDFVIVGEAADGNEACRLIEVLRPDVVLMDVEMPGRDGLAATADVRARWPSVPVVILSMYDDNETRSKADQAGAAGFVAKAELESRLIRTIRDVAGNYPITG